MAFGFLGDIVENIGEVILPRGTRGSTIGGAIGGALTGGSPGGAALGSAIGSGFTQNLSREVATGSPGQEAISSPTPSQGPAFAPESAMSGDGYQQTPMPVFSAGFTPRLPGPVTSTAAGAAGGAIMDIIPDINITKFFGSDPCMKKMPKLVGMTKDGCPTVTRKQQRVLRQMAQYMPLESVAYEAGVDTTTMARLISKSFPPRSRGISGAQLRTANRVNNKILSMAGKLGYNVTPKTKAQLGCK
jgi:hypothetical protein